MAKNVSTILVTPVTTEKAYGLSQKNVYVFNVPQSANKNEIADAVKTAAQREREQHGNGDDNQQLQTYDAVAREESVQGGHVTSPLPVCVFHSTRCC